jgi:hypothetical protein
LPELAAQAALDLSSERLEVAAEFLNTGHILLVSIAVADLIVNGDKEIVGNFLKPYLYRDNETVRNGVMAFFVFRYEHQELKDLLDQYVRQPIYYFDVVCCFDRVLYAPPRLRSFYRTSVERTLLGFFDGGSNSSTDSESTAEHLLLDLQ